MATEKTVDVCVIGAGIFGLSSAWACLQQGRSVLVLEADHVGAGASGGVVGAMAPHTPERWNDKKQFQFEALRVAKDYWAQVDAVSGLPSGYGQIGRQMPILDERGLAHAQDRIAQSKELWHGEYDWTIRATSAFLDPAATPFGVVHETLAARIHPQQACCSLAQAFKIQGGEILENVAMIGVESGRVHGDGIKVNATSIILADGVCGFTLINEVIGKPIGKGVKGQAAVLDVDLRGHPQTFADGTYIIPHENGFTAIGSTSENTYDDPKSNDDQLDGVINKARALVPALRDATVVRRWANARPKGRRRNPMLGVLPGYQGVYVANSAFKIGFGIAHKVGSCMADFVTTGRADIPPSFTIDHHIGNLKDQ